MDGTPATVESVIFAACIQAAIQLHQRSIMASEDGAARIMKIAEEYFEQAMKSPAITGD
ncbi:MAG: hypothetical protein HN478_05245 [Rhodospirillaceae bacterium]|jgi:hypothetical protein|nr:hypothetical protein [Rhodospirillaceae bacterium]MBT5193979.1 hypothetical protein [Rhodospirillaceae bacterium]MBT5898392.1 hypothetical protein [Rhodospirillaceae bacterium]MBT6430351.1 hypothetical protein [Rhodospirillaceae bacterium]MBT7757085.1 hypothetical protein [Rhodospirillaceae bacterium]